LLRSERSALSRTTKAARARRRLCHEIPLKIGDRNHRVVERRRDIDDPARDIFLLFLTKGLLLAGCCCFSHNCQWSVVSGQSQITTDNGSLTNLFLAWRFLLRDRRSSRSFARARICVRALSADRKPTSMTQSTISADIHQALDVHLD